MTRRYLKIVLVGSLFTLSACAQQSEVREMKQSVNTLNVAMDKLNKETVKITQQNALNAKSSNGVYLLPGANTPARLNSQIGTLRMSLVNVAANADGTRATLRIQGESNDPLRLQRHRRVGPDSGHHGELSGGECEESALHRPRQHAGTERC